MRPQGVPQMLQSLSKTVKQAVLPASLLLSQLAFGQFRTVTVQNSADNPVPATIENVPAVTINGTVPVSGNINASISNEPLVKLDITSPVPINGTVNATIANEPFVKLDIASPLPING